MLTHSNQGQGQDASGLDQAQLNAILAQGYRLTPATMAHRITDGRWLPAPHLLHTSTVVSNAIAKGNQFIIVTMPPRHGKSEFLSVHTPIWFLESFPHKRIILASYGAELATEFALKVRDTFQDEDLHNLLFTRLRRDRQKLDNFKTTEGGGMISIGVGGSVTGKGADLFLIDDYVKNAEEALSEAQKKKAWDWFQSTAFTRLEPGATIIVLATRWDKKDLIGMILDQFEEMEELGFEPPTIINFPAIATEHDILGRKPGQALWPFRYDEKSLMRIKATLGTYWWEALYQQNPKASMLGVDLGACLKLIEPKDMPSPNFLKTVRCWDMAATEQGGDFSAGPLMHVHTKTQDIYISDCFHKQVSPRKLEEHVAFIAEADGPGVSIWAEQEPGSAGKALIEHYQHDILPQYTFKGEKSTGPIEVRAQPFLAAVEAGRVHVVNGPWVSKLVEELDDFPEAEHDDILTACALGYRRLCRGRFGSAVWGRDRNYAGRRETVTHTRKEPRKTLGVVW